VDGFAPVTVPLSRRQDPTIVAAGHFILVYGGYIYDASKKTRVRPLGDGAVYDVTKGEWTALPDAPFDQPLYQASAAWTGSEVVITGTPCTGTPGDDSEGDYVECKPGGHAIGAYSPTKRTWREIKAPPGLSADFGGQITPIQIHAFGFANGRVLFDATASVLDVRRLLLLDPRTNKSDLVTVPDAGIDVVCVTGGKLIAAHTGDANPGPILTFELDPSSMQWKQLPDAMRAFVAPALFIGQPICSAGQLVYFPILQPPVGLDAGALWYEPDRQNWVQLPRFGPIGYADFAAAQLNGTRALWSERSDDLYLLPPGAVDWVRTKHPVSGRARFSVLDDAILVDAASDSATPRTLALFDPNGFLKSNRRVDQAPIGRVRRMEYSPRDEVGPKGRVEWLRALGGSLVSELRATPPETVVWTWHEPDQSAAFVARRTSHELAIHRVDAQLARGSAEPVETELAADGIEEVFLLATSPGAETRVGSQRGRADTHATLHLHGTDFEPAEWLLTSSPTASRSPTSTRRAISHSRARSATSRCCSTNGRR
jgi:hypothetical protein